MRFMARQRAQELLLGRSPLRPEDIARFYEGSRGGSDRAIAKLWEDVFASSPLRIHLSEAPQAEGSSARWMEEIDAKICAFRKRFGWLIDPLLIPVAVEVVVKPPPPTRQRGLHDLDNVLRRYLIPSIVTILKPISSYRFAFDDQAIRHAAPHWFAHPSFVPHKSRTPPASTRPGVNRFEAWRLPPAREGDPGFVSAAVVTGWTGYGGVFSQIDKGIDKWRDMIDRIDREAMNSRLQ